jgi:ribosome biogenesis protein MAK21
MHGSSALSCGTLYLISAVVGKKSIFEQVCGDGKEEYDPKKRDPVFSNADQDSVWELVMSQNHYHPSVRAFCSQMNEDGKIKYNGDPLVDFSLKSFLNRFSYRNPKMNEEDSVSTREHKGKNSTENVSNMAPVNSSTFLQQPVGRVRPDEMFFYRFFSEKARRDAMRPDKNKKKKDEQSGTMMSEEDAEEAFAQRLAESLMKDEGDEDEEIEFSMSESESEMDDDEDDDDDDDMDQGENEESRKRRKKRQLYAAAEEFADVLESAGGERSSDKSSKKQADWEEGKLRGKKKRRRR